MHIRKTLAEIKAEVALTKSQPTTHTPKQPSPQEPDLCPSCGTPAETGYFRRDLDYDHPDFGKLIKCQHPFHDDVRVERVKAVSDLGPGEIKKRLSDIAESPQNAAMLTAAREMVNTPYGWLYIWGGPGNAKTDALQAIVNELNFSGKGPAVYSTFSEVLDFMRQGYGDKAKLDYHERFQRLKMVKALAIDEMDKARRTEFAEEFRFNFLDDRYRSAIREETVTIFAGNTDPAKLEVDPIYDRIRDGRFKVVQNSAPSARPEMRR